MNKRKTKAKVIMDHVSYQRACCVCSEKWSKVKLIDSDSMCYVRLCIKLTENKWPYYIAIVFIFLFNLLLMVSACIWGLCGVLTHSSVLHVCGSYGSQYTTKMCMLQIDTLQPCSPNHLFHVLWFKASCLLPKSNAIVFCICLWASL